MKVDEASCVPGVDFLLLPPDPLPGLLLLRLQSPAEVVEVVPIEVLLGFGLGGDPVHPAGATGAPVLGVGVEVPARAAGVPTVAH